MKPHPGRRSIALVTAAVLVAAAGAYASSVVTGRVGKKEHLLANGRLLRPAGALVQLGNFPTGGALTPDGRYYWTVSTGRGKHDIRIVSTATARVVQIIPLPGASGGIVMDPHKAQAYVSGIQDTTHTDTQQLKLPGRAGDNVQVFTYNKASGKAKFSRLFSVPPPPGSPIPQGIVSIPGLEGPPQEFPPTSTKRLSWPDHLAVSADGKQLLVPLNLADHAAIVDTAHGTVKYVQTGRYPYAAAILPDGKTGVVTNESEGSITTINMNTGARVATHTVGPPLSHPEGITLDPRGTRAFIAMANTDKVVVVSTLSWNVITTLSLRHKQGLGSAPVSVAITPNGSRLVVAEEGTNSLAVFTVPGDPSSKTYRLVGRIPTADFPAHTQVVGSTLVYLAAKGLGVGPNPTGPNPLDKHNNDNQINVFTYLPSIVTGNAGILPWPSDSQVAAMSATAEGQIHPSNAEKPPADTVLKAGGPIKHVFYIVKENRTYDQVLGDLGRGDSDPRLSLFGRKTTPNIHALVDRFPLLDHLYANSEASIDGHMWASAGSVSDYLHKNWFANYGGRGRPYDFGVYSVTWPGNGFLFDQAARDGISYFNYGEAIAGVLPLPDKDRPTLATAQVVEKFSHSDLGLGTRVGVAATPGGQCYPNDADIDKNAITMQATWDSTPPAGASPLAESRFDCFSSRFKTQLATGTVPAFNYLSLPNNHTVGTSPGRRTPQALLADNDYGLGQIVDLISHSSIWNSSAIFVIEDDSQDGADHVDAHRIPAGVFSPYAKKGAIVSTRYDFLSVIRSMELILGMHSLGLFDQLATPMYDAFTSKPVNLAPYTAIVPTQSRTQLNKATSPGAALSASLDFSRADKVDQQVLDGILWQSVYGADATPPPPGPGASSKTPAAGDGDK